MLDFILHYYFLNVLVCINKKKKNKDKIEKFNTIRPVFIPHFPANIAFPLKGEKGGKRINVGETFSAKGNTAQPFSELQEQRRQ